MKLYTIFFLLVPFCLIGQNQIEQIWGTYVNGTVSNGSLDFYLNPKIANDLEGNIYVGNTTDRNSGISTVGAHSTMLQGESDVFISRIDQNGNLIWSTYFGGSGREKLFGLVVKNGELIICGSTTSTDNIAFNSSYLISPDNGANAFVAKFDVNGNLLWSTYVPFTFNSGCDVNEQGEIIVCGSTTATGFATSGTYGQHNLGESDLFLMKFFPQGALIWSTYFGGEGSENSGNTICKFDQNDNIILISLTNSTTNIASQNAFMSELTNSDKNYVIAKFTSSGQRIWSTYFGGTGSNYLYGGHVDENGNIYLVGETTSENLATPNAFQEQWSGGIQYDGLISRFDEDGYLTWSTYYGGSRHEEVFGVDVDLNGNVYIAGYSDSEGMASLNCMNDTLASDSIEDTFFAKFDVNGNRIWASYFGGTLEEFDGKLVLGSNGEFYIAGISRSENGITTSGAYQQNPIGGYNIFLAKFFEKNWNNGFENKKLIDVVVYPNPTHSDILISGLDQFVNYQIQLIDAKGVVVSSLQSEGKEMVKIANHQFSSGLYIVQLQSDSEFIQMKLIVD